MLQRRQFICTGVVERLRIFSAKVANQSPFRWQVPRSARLRVEQVEMQSAKQKEGGRGVEPENPEHLP